jgi:hypothetical protein
MFKPKNPALEALQAARMAGGRGPMTRMPIKPRAPGESRPHSSAVLPTTPANRSKLLSAMPHINGFLMNAASGPGAPAFGGG